MVYKISLCFRNNLTILDLVMVQGQGAQTNFNINGNAPGGKSSVLLFEIKPVHLKDCNSKPFYWFVSFVLLEILTRSLPRQISCARFKLPPIRWQYRKCFFKNVWKTRIRILCVFSFPTKIIKSIRFWVNKWKIKNNVVRVIS